MMTALGVILFGALLLAGGLPGSAGRDLARREAKEGAPSKHLYCKQSGKGCQANEEIERYCADTGFKELLRCSTNEKHASWPPHVSQQRSFSPQRSRYSRSGDDDDTSVGEDEIVGAGSLFRVVRSCTEKTVAAHTQALVDEVAAAEKGRGGASHHLGLFPFELAMMLVVGVSLPVVYWRKIRIRHL
ncbi:hypothetical protein TSOC_005621 [Tetrabaena socialis]|uniref:Uncharacterized protein n=1 Tax=Tetrabaena socialis TaxID=47790 RepID=A0A2J8A5U1_9CHLO|nr:hypothetical protein TSOC_005621 [Tetrabaena socialis]|eukprot:PNH07889.1 hypothetical protein TSOC_005621 [Tetrabaena socialis]